MAVSIQPLAGYVVAHAEAAETKTASGLLLTQTAQEKPQTAVIVATGKDVKEVKAGDRILYKTYSATDVKFGTEDYLLIKEEDILGIVK